MDTPLFKKQKEKFLSAEKLIQLISVIVTIENCEYNFSDNGEIFKIGHRMFSWNDDMNYYNRNEAYFEKSPLKYYTFKYDRIKVLCRKYKIENILAT